MYEIKINNTSMIWRNYVKKCRLLASRSQNSLSNKRKTSPICIQIILKKNLIKYVNKMKSIRREVKRNVSILFRKSIDKREAKSMLILRLLFSNGVNLVFSCATTSRSGMNIWTSIAYGD